MPYRRLPNTDQARLRTLKRAVQRASEAEFTERVLSYRTQQEAEKMLMQLENQVAQFQSNYDAKVKVNKDYRRIVGSARMYISHFIQVLNMSVQRGEIKRDQKLLYGLDPSSNTVPDLANDEALIEWGRKIIDGEMQRTANGGFPIYNPNISKVKVHYDMLREHVANHSFMGKTTDRVQADLSGIREEADKLILTVWNEIEQHFADCLPYDRLMKCQSYGVIYYYRPGETHLSAETDKKIAEGLRRQTTLEWRDLE